jgi:predicted aldo/keto reductase-like oxidoreductase
MTTATPRFAYTVHTKPHQRASSCVARREWESKCPQHILVSEWMSKIEAVLGEKEG